MFVLRYPGLEENERMYMTLDEEGWCKVSEFAKEATLFQEDINAMGKVRYIVAGGQGAEFTGYYLSYSDNAWLGVYHDSADATHWFIDRSASMIAMNWSQKGQKISICDKEDSDDNGYLALVEPWPACFVATELYDPGRVAPPAPVYMAYKNPLQFVGFEVQQDANNPWAMQSALDFRYAPGGQADPFRTPYCSTIANKPSSFSQAPRPDFQHPAKFAYMPPDIRYPGVVEGTREWGPLGLALEQPRPGEKMKGGQKMIVGLQPDGPAEQAGARIGDFIVEVNRTPLGQNMMEVMQSASKVFEKGEPIVITILRQGMISHIYMVPPQQKARPKGLGRQAGPNPPQCFNEILTQWYQRPAGRGEVLENI